MKRAMRENSYTRESKIGEANAYFSGEFSSNAAGQAI